MTPVLFHFVTPTGLPIANTVIEIQLSKSTFDTEDSGVLMPSLVTATTDVDGKATVNLWPNTEMYYVTVMDPTSDAGLSYKFIVPEVTPGMQVRLQDIVVVGEISPTTYDAAALLVIQGTKAITLSYQVAAAASAAEAVVAATAAADTLALATTAAIEVPALAASALASKNAAAASETAAGLSAIAAAASDVSSTAAAVVSSAKAAEAVISASDAAGSVITAGAAAGTATSKAGEASTSATAAVGSATTAAADATTATTQAGIATAKAVLTAADSAQTALDRAATGADSAQTALDRIATAADRVQTGADRTAATASAAASAGDAVATAADRAQTTLDRAATAADRVQTGADVTASAGSAATATTKAGEASGSAVAAAASAVLAAGYAGGGVTTFNGRNAAVTLTTGDVTGVLAKADIGLGNVDNTSDVNKPVSTAQATADTAIGTAAATDATTKANAAQAAAIAASAPVAHVGAGGAAHADAVASGAAGFMTGADKTKLDGVSGTNTGDETEARIAALNHAAAVKSALVDADEITGQDSAASFGLIRTTWTSVKAFLKTYFDSLYAALATVNTFTKAQRGAFVTLTDAATIAIDLSLGNNFSVTLGGNRTLGVPTNAGAGQQGLIGPRQDGTGSRTLAYSFIYNYAGGSAPALTTGVGFARDMLAYGVESFASGVVTMTIATPCVVTLASHGLYHGDKAQLTTTGALTTGLAASTTYWVHVIDANTFHLSTTKANAAAGTYIATTGSQSGVHSIIAGDIGISAAKDWK